MTTLDGDRATAIAKLRLPELCSNLTFTFKDGVCKRSNMEDTQRHSRMQKQMLKIAQTVMLKTENCRPPAPSSRLSD